jgi:hypothetical protein
VNYIASPGVGAWKHIENMRAKPFRRMQVIYFLWVACNFSLVI